MEAVVNHNLKGYELRERIGAGGFGAVYRAYQSTVGREVAIKIILPGLANQPEFIRRFEGEAQLVARLEHPYIVPLHDYWRDPDGAYLVMRWLKGGSLRDVLEQGAFDLRSAALLLDQIAGALSLAHRNNIIHRDIKPGNILLDEDGNAYLTDFGIAKDLNLSGNNTQPDAIVGSLDYISPEQARSEPITARTDIYSLGVTLYEVITGHHPFENVSSIERLYKHINDPLPEITTLNTAVNAQVNHVIQKATAKNPDHRYADALAFAADFREAVGLNRIPTAVELLTQREQETLQLIIDGLSNKEIAIRLTVTLGTVKWHVNQIYAKLGVRSRVQAMVRARELNLLTKSSESPSLVQIPTEDFQPENPYKGLRAFQSADNQDFFGREKVTAKLVKRLEEAHEFARFLAIIGPSGSGKSSLVKAGLIPALWRGELAGSEKWFVVELLPGAHPLDELEVALIRVAANNAGSLKEQLSRDRRGLIRAAQVILPADGSELVLVIDQFEEVFTLLDNEGERAQFLDLLYTAVTETRSRVRVILTLRADFYDRPLYYPQFGELVRSRLETIMPLSAEELERAITNPAKRAGVTFEPGLAAGIIADVNYQPGALPLLQYALTELFEQRQGHLLKHEAYQAIGGTVSALAKRADEIYLDLDDAGQEAARQMFLRLVTLGEGTEDTRRRAARSELLTLVSDSEVMDDVLDTYAEYRLLSLDNDPRSHTPTVEVAHEALLREWERLRAWLKESREDVRLQRQLTTLTSEWHGSKQDMSFLLHGARLEMFEKWLQSTRLALTEKEREYVNASLTQRTKEAATEESRQANELKLARDAVTSQKSAANRLRQLVAVMALAVIGALVLSGVAINQGQIAQANAAIADRNAAEVQNVALIAGSQAALANRDTDEALALAVQAVTLYPNSIRAQVALGEAAYAMGTIRRFVGHTDVVDWVAYSPDGQTAASASWDHSVILWNLQTGEIIRRFEGHRAEATSVAFTPDGLSIISGSADQTLIQWEVQTGEIIRRFEGQAELIPSVAVSPNRLYVASGGYDGSIILWDIQTGDIIRRFEGHSASAENVSFNADGSQLLSASDDWSAILWDIQTGDIIRRFEGHTAAVSQAVFSPDGSMVATASLDNTLILWDVATGEIIRRFYPRRGWVSGVAFTPDGQSLFSGVADGTLFLWDIATGEQIIRFYGHTSTLMSLAVSPDGRTALSSSMDGTIRLWDLQGGQVIRRFAGHTDWANAAVRSPDGRTGITTSVDGTAILWDLQTGEEIRRYTSSYSIQDAAYSPDGRTVLLALGLYDQPSDLILWDVESGAEIRHLVGHPAAVNHVSFSPDGRVAVSCGDMGTIILWDVATGEEIRRFHGYESDNPDPPWSVYSVIFSPDGVAVLANLFDGTLVSWDVATGEQLQRYEGHTFFAGQALFTPDGQHIFSGAWDNTAIYWDTETGAIVHRFTDHNGAVFRVAMTPDGRIGLGGSADNTTILWDLATGDVIRRYVGPNTGVFSAAFDTEGRTALVSFYDGSVELWRVDPTLDELLTWTRANRYIPELTCDQRALYRLEPLCAETTTP